MSFASFFKTALHVPTDDTIGKNIILKLELCFLGGSFALLFEVIHFWYSSFSSF